MVVELGKGRTFGVKSTSTSFRKSNASAEGLFLVLNGKSTCFVHISVIRTNYVIILGILIKSPLMTTCDSTMLYAVLVGHHLWDLGCLPCGELKVLHLITHSLNLHSTILQVSLITVLDLWRKHSHFRTSLAPTMENTFLYTMTSQRLSISIQDSDCTLSQA